MNYKQRVLIIVCLGVLLVGDQWIIKTNYSKIGASYVCYYMYKIGLWATSFTRMPTCALEKRLERYKKDNEDLRKELIVLQSVVDYVEDAKDIRQFVTRYDEKQVEVVQVLARHFGKDRHLFIVEGGADKNVMPGDIATYKQCLLGKITDVFPWYSVVQLITDSPSHVSVYCAQTKTIGILSGVADSTMMTLDFVNHYDPLRCDDMLITTGLGGEYPRGFCAGIIRKFRPRELYHDVIVNPAIDFDEINYCSILHR